MSGMLRPERLTEHEGRARAGRHLSRLIGNAPNDLCWDDDHHLRGHVHIGEREFVVIAPRDDVHEPILLLAEDWDEVCHASSQHAADIVRERAIRAQL